MNDADNEEYHPVAQYQSEDEETEEAPEEAGGNDGADNADNTRQDHGWRTLRLFETGREAEAWVQTLNISSTKEYDTNDGKVKLYRCSEVPWRGPQCRYSFKLLYHDDSLQVTAFESVEVHTHDEILARRPKLPQGINKASKAHIDRLLGQRVNVPKTILRSLEAEIANNPNIKVPTQKQLYNYISAEKRKKGPTQMNFDALSDWCRDHYEIPVEEDEVFVASYQVNIDGDEPENWPEDVEIENPEESMRLFLTSKSLLRLASEHCKVLQADATYKLLWLGYPVLIIGISDSCNVFHPLGMSISRDEKADDFAFIFNSLQVGLERCGLPKLDEVDLLADAADSISNGFARVFSPDHAFKRGNCKFHWLILKKY
jgi:hypothetical protein